MLEYASGVVQSMVAELNRKKKNFRSFELSREFSLVLGAYGNFEIKDGTVTYSSKHLIEKYIPPSWFKSNPGLRSKLLKKGSFSTFHSWCEWETDEGTILIDYHPRLEVDGVLIGTDLVIIGYKERIPYKYYSSSFRLGRLLFLLKGLYLQIVYLKN